MVSSTSMLRFCLVSSAVFNCFIKIRSSAVFSNSKSYTCFGSKVTFCFGPANGLFNIEDKSTFCSLSSSPSRTLSRSERPTNSSTVCTPSFAMYSRSSSAIKCMKLMTYSGFPLKRLRSSGFCVAIPTGQVSKLQTRIITHPMVTSGAVANPNSSAPRSAAMATSLPVISFPSVSILTLFLSPFIIKV